MSGASTLAPDLEPGAAPSKGRLLLVPNTLDLNETPVDIRDVLPDGVLRASAQLLHWVAEDARTTRAYLKRVAQVYPLARPIQQIHIAELPRPAKGKGPRDPDTAVLGRLLAPAMCGEDLGLISEAGLAGVADPGAALVACAHREGVPVLALAGPSSITLALAASGLEGQRFCFVGYLPQEAQARISRIRELEAQSRRLGQTQIAIETPYRNRALLQTLLSTLSPDTRLSVSVGLTLEHGFSHTHTVSAWRSSPERAQAVLSAPSPAVFVFLAHG